MASNLPPGVTESMLPGNRPEDAEVEVTLVLTKGEIDDLRTYNDNQQKIPIANRDFLWDTVENIVEQLP